MPDRKIKWGVEPRKQDHNIQKPKHHIDIDIDWRQTTMGQIITTEKILTRLPVSKLNQFRIGYWKEGGHPLLGLTGIPNPRLTTVLVLVVGWSFYFVPMEYMKRKLRNEMQHRVDERKLREGLFVLQMLEYFDTTDNDTSDRPGGDRKQVPTNHNNPTRELLTVKRRVMETIELMPGYTTMVEAPIGDDNDDKTELGVGVDTEEDLIDVERWPFMFEQRHSLFYRNEVRKKLEMVRQQIEQLQQELRHEQQAWDKHEKQGKAPTWNAKLLEL